MSTPLQTSNYTGFYYAFGASGGFTVLQKFLEPVYKPEIIHRYDVTDAVQLKFSVTSFNKKLGILKDASNINVVQAWLEDTSSNCKELYNNSIKICSCEFINGIDTNSVLSVGRLKDLYNDFQNTVYSYFGTNIGFSPLFYNDNPDYNSDDECLDYDRLEPGNSFVDFPFDASAFIQIVNKSKFNMKGSYVSDLSGYITVDDINTMLDYACDTNLFNNRPTNTGHKWGVIDGFIEGDLVFVPEGLTVTLSIDLSNEIFASPNNNGPANLLAIDSSLNWKTNSVTRKTTYNNTNITQITTLPVLFVLNNEIVDNALNYGIAWRLAPINTIFPNIKDWVAISLSANAQFQSLITSNGLVFTTNNYGSTWQQTYTIEPSPSNSIAMSFTGKHQTISNGHAILVSNDYGQTWSQTFDAGTSNIFVSIALSGRYQSLVSCGDTLYLSSDYGFTWSPIPQDSNLYLSIEAFPSSGIAVSYTGKYQTLVVEDIYCSSDFGKTWVNTISSQNEFDDHNWEGIAMSSDGQHQTAIENGGNIYVSHDYGQSWDYVNQLLVMGKEWWSVSVSATGQYQTVLEQTGHVYTSIDYGDSWTQVEDQLVANKTWQTVAVSSDGLYQVVIDTNGTIYSSTTFSTVLDSSGSSCVCL